MISIKLTNKMSSIYNLVYKEKGTNILIITAIIVSIMSRMPNFFLKLIFAPLPSSYILKVIKLPFLKLDFF